MNLTEWQVWSLERVGHLMAKSGRLADARTIFDGLTRMAPDRSYSWWMLANIASERGDKSKALDYARHAVAIDRTARNLLLCGELQLSEGDRDGAAQTLSGIDQLPDDPHKRRALIMRRRWLGR